MAKKEGKAPEQTEAAPKKKVEDENPDFKFLVRIVNTDIDGHMPLYLALAKVRGVGRRVSIKIVDNLEFQRTVRIGDMSDEDIDKLQAAIENIWTRYTEMGETDLEAIVSEEVEFAQACLDEALRYAKDRVQFGRPIFNFQATQFKLVDMAVSIEMARNLYLKAAWLKDQGRKHSFEASATKLFASEMLERVASDAVQIHGGYGYMNEYPVSRYYKNAKLLQILEGTSEVQRLVIANYLLR